MMLFHRAKGAVFWRSLAGSGALGAALASLPGCGVAAMIETNTAAIKDTTGVMRSATERVGEANRSLASMQPSLQGIAALERPMRETASLARPLEDAVAMGPKIELMQRTLEESTALRGPMLDVAGLKPAMEGIVPLKKPLEDVAELGPTLESVAALRGSMEGVAALDPKMKALAELKGPMERVADLRPSLEEMSKLSGPISDIARATRSGGPSTGTFALVLLGWTAATFAGVFLGFVAGARYNQRRRIHARRGASARVYPGEGAAATRGTTRAGSSATPWGAARRPRGGLASQ